jgi:deoxyribose-phosphate aldolase
MRDLDLPRPLARYIDHTLLKPEAAEPDLLRVLGEAREAGFAAACIPPCWVPLAADQLAGSDTAVCTVIAFPLGYADPRARREESRQALLDGARELDTVINLSWLKSGRAAAVLEDLRTWVDACRQAEPSVVLKVILETALLSRDEKLQGAELAVAAAADFVKTSTGFAGGGATVADVALLREAVAGQARIKASGGIRTREDALALIAAGADRLGTSSGLALVAGTAPASGPY